MNLIFKTSKRTLRRLAFTLLIAIAISASLSSDIYAITFTPNVSKRNSSGPFAAGIMFQGDYDSMDMDTGDLVSFNNGSQLGQNSGFYNYFDQNQGTVVFWITPEWNGNDGKTHFVYSVNNYGGFSVVKSQTNKLCFVQFYKDMCTIGTDVSSWQAGTTYNVVLRWNLNSDIGADGSNYVITINDVETSFPSVTPTEVVSDWTPITTVGYTTLETGNLNALIEGLTVYRRPLYDGAYGIDVGNGDEIAKIYDSDENSDNGITPKDPTLITGSWDVVFALPTNASSGSITSGVGNAWSHPHSSNLLYTDATNTGGFMLNGTYTTDGWNIANWYNNSWTKRKSITIDESMVSGSSNLTSFPILISVTDAGLASDAQDDGDDIVFTSSDGLTKLNHEIESFNGATGELIAWVNVPTLNATTNTTLYMYYGNASASSQQNPTSTWNSSYKAVWHMNQDPSGTAPQLLDSTQNNNDGTSEGGMDSGDSVIGKMGKGTDYDGGDARSRFTDNSSLKPSNAVTFSAWVKNHSTGCWGKIIDRDYYANGGWAWPYVTFSLSSSFSCDGTPYMDITTSGSNSKHIASTALANDTWYFVTGTWDGTVMKVYVNGVSENGETSKTGSLDYAYSSDPVLGNRSPYTPGEAINGVLDEVRIADSAKSSDWILTEYNNQNSPATYLTFSSEQTPPSVAALATSEKIYAGGYKVTSGASLGIYRTFTATDGGDYVLRAVGNSDGSCNPQVKITRADGTTEISHMNGTTSSTRTDPDVYIYTWQSPAAENNQIQLLNTSTSGTCTWHQVEVLSNLFDNPSMESGGGDPWIPAGWLTGTDGPDRSGESIQSTDNISGGHSFEYVNADGGCCTQILDQNVLVNLNRFYSLGAYGKLVSGTNKPGFTPYNNYVDALRYQGSNNGVDLFTGITNNWALYQAVTRLHENIWRDTMSIMSSGATSARVDDLYAYELQDITLTVTPSNLSNSTENTDEIRVDGRDTYVASGEEVTGINAATGYVSFDYRPRHSASDITSYGETTPYIASLYGDANDYINVYWNANNSVTLSYSMDGVTGSGTWNATSAITENTQYVITLSYTGGGNMILSVGGTPRITLSSIPSSFGTSPNTVYFGSSSSGLSQGDATYSSIGFTIPPTPTPTVTNTPTATPTATPTLVPYQSPWTQTNWVDGSGQTSWLHATKYSDSSGVDISVPGQITLARVSNWYNTAWNYRRKITFDNSAQDENLVDFPLLVKLDSNRINYSNTQNSGQDIRFTDSDGVTLLSYEIEKWDESGTSLIWVKVPQINLSSSTDNIYVYYGNASASDAQVAGSVWSSNFEAVYHLKESGNGTLGEYVDSTTNSHNGQGGAANGDQTPVVTSNGAINGAQVFDGNNDFIKIPASDELYFPGAFTIDAWVKRTGTPGSGFGGYVFSDYDATGNFSSFAMRLNGSGTYTANTMSFFGSSGSSQAVSTTVLALNTWYHVVGVWDGTNRKIYINGVLENTNSGSETRGNPHAYSSIGRPGEYPGLNFPGHIDEVRIGSGAQSADWIAALYKSESDTFGTYGASETQYESNSGTLISSIYDTGRGSNWGNLTYNATTPSNTSVTVKARSSNSESMTNATDFSLCTSITSASDISSSNCVTDNQRFIQYQLTLSNTDSISSPTFQDISIGFEVADNTSPTIYIQPISPDPINNSSPTFLGTASESVDTVASVEYQMDSTSSVWSSCIASDSIFDEANETFSCTLLSTLAEGSHTVYIRSRDSNGNVTNAGNYASDQFTIDISPPLLNNIVSPNASNTSSNPVFKFSLATDTGGSGVSSYGIVVNQDKPVSTSLSNIPFTSGETSSEIILKDDSEAKVVLIGKNTTDTSDDKLSLSFPYFASHSLPDGENTFKLIVRDNAGNTLTKELKFNVGASSSQSTVDSGQTTATPTPTVNIQALNLTSEVNEDSLDLVKVSAEDDMSPTQKPKQKVSPSITPTPTMILEITDTNGKPIPDTMIKIEGVTNKAVSDKEGNIILSSLAPGTYKIQIISKEDGSILGEQTVKIDEQGVKKIRITLETHDAKNLRTLNLALGASLIITLVSITACLIYQKRKGV